MFALCFAYFEQVLGLFHLMPFIYYILYYPFFKIISNLLHEVYRQAMVATS